MRLSCNSRRGYILLETLLAVAVVSTGLAAVLAGFRVSLAAARRAETVTVATLLAEGKMAELRAIPPEIIGASEGDFGEAQPAYRWRADIRPVPQRNFYAIVLEVWWLEGGQERSVALASLLPVRPIGEIS
jgi:hypothetical protein